MHTPGPWTVSDGTPDIGIVTDRVLVAMVTNDEDYPCERDEQEANARLIAAAPELLEALRECARYIEDNAPYNAVIVPHLRALEAIRKAEG